VSVSGVLSRFAAIRGAADQKGDIARQAHRARGEQGARIGVVTNFQAHGLSFNGLPDRGTRSHVKVLQRFCLDPHTEQFCSGICDVTCLGTAVALQKLSFKGANAPAIVSLRDTICKV
jgi:hypothetical protein